MVKEFRRVMNEEEEREELMLPWLQARSATLQQRQGWYFFSYF
jgi:hypothetical protein